MLGRKRGTWWGHRIDTPGTQIVYPRNFTSHSLHFWPFEYSPNCDPTLVGCIAVTKLYGYGLQRDYVSNLNRTISSSAQSFESGSAKFWRPLSPAQNFTLKFLSPFFGKPDELKGLRAWVSESNLGPEATNRAAERTPRKLIKNLISVENFGFPKRAPSQKNDISGHTGRGKNSSERRKDPTNKGAFFFIANEFKSIHSFTTRVQKANQQTLLYIGVEG